MYIGFFNLSCKSQQNIIHINLFIAIFIKKNEKPIQQSVHVGKILDVFSKFSHQNFFILDIHIFHYDYYSTCLKIDISALTTGWIQTKINLNPTCLMKMGKKICMDFVSTRYQRSRGRTIRLFDSRDGTEDLNEVTDIITIAKAIV